MRKGATLDVESKTASKVPTRRPVGMRIQFETIATQVVSIAPTRDLTMPSLWNRNWLLPGLKKKRLQLKVITVRHLGVGRQAAAEKQGWAVCSTNWVAFESPGLEGPWEQNHIWMVLCVLSKRKFYCKSKEVSNIPTTTTRGCQHAMQELGTA